MANYTKRDALQREMRTLVRDILPSLVPVRRFAVPCWCGRAAAVEVTSPRAGLHTFCMDHEGEAWALFGRR